MSVTGPPGSPTKRKVLAHQSAMWRSSSCMSDLDQEQAEVQYMYLLLEYITNYFLQEMLAERDAKIRELEETIKTLQSKLSVCESSDISNNVENIDIDKTNGVSQDTDENREDEHNAEEDFVNIEPNGQ